MPDYFANGGADDSAPRDDLGSRQKSFVDTHQFSHVSVFADVAWLRHSPELAG